MIKLKTSLQILLLCTITFSSAWLQATIRLVAEIGQSAEDFPAGFVYWGLDNPVIGSAGHIAFSGAADVSVRATENHTHAVWSGLPGHLKVITRENDVLANAPQGLLFRSAVESSLIVNSSGNVAFMARFKGNHVNSQNERGLLAHVNGATFLVMQLDQPAPGLPAGTVIQTIRDFVFTNGGILILAEASGPSFLGQGLWFWNFNTLEFIPSPIPGCNYSNISGLGLNHNGEAVFISLLSNEAGTLCHPHRGIFKWHNGLTHVIVTDGDPVPGMPQTVFTLGLFPLKSTITDQGEIIFTTTLMDTTSSELRNSTWLAHSDGRLDLLVMDGETLSGDPNPGNVLYNSDIFSNIESTDGGLSIVRVARTANHSTAIAFGNPRALLPYTNIQEASISQLSVVTQLGHQPPGFDSTWFVGALSGEVAINKAGQFAFSSIIANTLDIVGSQRAAIWRGAENMAIELAASTGMTLFANGTVRTLGGILGLNRHVNSLKRGGSTVGGSATQFSDRGEIVFAGSMENNNLGGIFLVTDGKREKRIFELAEQLFPELFSPANPYTQNAEGFWYRHYPTTNSYIGIREDDVFVLGDAFGPDILRFDTIDNTLQFLEAVAQPDTGNEGS